MEQSDKVEHKVQLIDRSSLTVSAVEDVLGFDDSVICAKTVMGILNIDGSELHISKLDIASGVLTVSGKIDSLYYTEPAVKRGLFKRSAK